MVTDERARLAALRETVETNPGDAAWRAVCTLIASDDPTFEPTPSSRRA